MRPKKSENEVASRLSCGLLFQAEAQLFDFRDADDPPSPPAAMTAAAAMNA